MVEFGISPTSPKLVYIRVGREVSDPGMANFREWLRIHGFPVDPLMVLPSSNITLTALQYQTEADASRALALLQEHEHEIDTMEYPACVTCASKLYFRRNPGAFSRTAALVHMATTCALCRGGDASKQHALSCLQPDTYTCQDCDFSTNSRNRWHIHHRLLHRNHQAVTTVNNNGGIYVNLLAELSSSISFSIEKHTFGSTINSLTHLVDVYPLKLCANNAIIACPICDMAFATSDLLRVHVGRAHVRGYQYFACVLCGSRFNEYADVEMHFKMNHRADSPGFYLELRFGVEREKVIDKAVYKPVNCLLCELVVAHARSFAREPLAVYEHLEQCIACFKKPSPASLKYLAASKIHDQVRAKINREDLSSGLQWEAKHINMESRILKRCIRLEIPAPVADYIAGINRNIRI